MIPEFIVGYICGFGSVVFGILLTALLIHNKKDEVKDGW